jgi:predicted choloylglycine hydrolase
MGDDGKLSILTLTFIRRVADTIVSLIPRYLLGNCINVDETSKALKKIVFLRNPKYLKVDRFISRV